MAFSVREQRSSRADAEALLQGFCQCVEHGSIKATTPEADRLLEHVRHSLDDYLSAKTSGIESAFGLTKRKGRPPADEQERIRMAARVLDLYIAGMSHEDAIAKTGDEFRRSETVISDAFRKWRQLGWMLLQPTRDPLTAEEQARLRKVFPPE